MQKSTDVEERDAPFLIRTEELGTSDWHGYKYLNRLQS